MTLRDLIIRVRDLLGRPTWESITDPQLIEYLLDWNQQYCGWLNLSGEGWLVAELSLVITPDLATVPIEDPGFAGALTIIPDPTVYGTDYRREIPVVRYQDLDRVDTGQAGGTVTWLGDETVAAVSFERDRNSGLWVASWTPAGAQGSYVVKFEPAYQTPKRKGGDVLALPAEFYGMLARAAALDALPLCAWQGFDDKQNALRRSQLEISLRTGLAKHEEFFDKRRRVKDQQQTRPRRMFGQSRPALQRMLGFRRRP